MAFLALTALLYLPTLNGYFLADDFGWLWLLDRLRAGGAGTLARVILLDDPARYVWGGELNHFLALPLLSWLLDLSLWRANPLGFHLTSLALHLVVAGLVYTLAARAIPRPLGALAAMLLFLASPAQVEPVLWVAARGHLLATLFALLAVLLFGRFRRTGSRRAYLGARWATVGGLASQEMAVVIPALVLLWDLALERPPPRGRGWLAAHAPFWALLLLYLVFRRVIFGAVSPAWSSTTPLDLAAWGRLADEVGQLGVVLAGGRWADLGLLALPRLLRLLFVLGALAVGAALLWRGWRGPMIFGVGWAFVALLPLLGPLTYGSRHFYLASVGAAMALGAAAAWAFEGGRARRLATVGIGAALLAVSLGALVGGTRQLGLAGAQSRQLHGELQTAARALGPGDGALVVLPELPGEPTVFWEDALPFALDRPFAEGVPLGRVLPSFASYCCDDWPQVYEPAVARLASGELGPAVVVEWRNGEGRFRARRLGPDGLRDGDYAARLRRL